MGANSKRRCVFAVLVCVCKTPLFGLMAAVRFDALQKGVTAKVSSYTILSVCLWGRDFGVRSHNEIYAKLCFN